MAFRRALACAVVTIGCLAGAQTAAAAPPTTTLLPTGPPVNGPTNDTTPTFEFTSSEAGSSFSCSIDSGPAFACSSPYTTPPLTEAGHDFSVTAINAGGEVGTRATRSFTVDITPPQTTITKGPAEGSVVNTDAPQFAYEANETSTFRCTADGVPLASCDDYDTAVTPGPHSFSVAATDLAGNTDPTPATRNFTVDLDAPPDFKQCPLDGNIVNGTSADDTRTGTRATDIMFGLAGNDVLLGLSRPDCLTGGPGNDRLSGGRGGDYLYGDGGSDRLTGGAGNDTLDGGSGNDRLSDSRGRDSFTGGAGNDRIQARDSSRFGRRIADRVRCGGGRLDIAFVDRRDHVSPDCERVRRR